MHIIFVVVDRSTFARNNKNHVNTIAYVNYVMYWEFVQFYELFAFISSKPSRFDIYNWYTIFLYYELLQSNNNQNHKTNREMKSKMHKYESWRAHFELKYMIIVLLLSMSPQNGYYQSWFHMEIKWFCFCPQEEEKKLKILRQQEGIQMKQRRKERKYLCCCTTTTKHEAAEK